MKGEEQIFFTDSNKNYDKTVSTSASEAVTYSVYYRETSTSAWKLDDSIWTISNIDIS